MMQFRGVQFFICAILLCALPAWLSTPATAVVVQYSFSLDGESLGTVDVRLLHTAMPRSVANFLQYVDDNDWDGSFIHRRASFADSGVGVVQGGGFIVPETGLIKDVGGNLMLDYEQVPTNPPINDEPGGGVAGPSNVRGTIAMAKSGKNTATSQWYFNTVNNTSLDNPNRTDGGFAAFGRVLGSGMSVIDEIAALPIFNVGSPFNTLPVADVAKIQSQVDVFTEDVVIVEDIRRLNIPAGDYSLNGIVNMNDYTVWKTNFGSTTNLAADGNGDGIVNAADYTVWRSTLGQSSIPGGGSVELGAIGVPEPGCVILAVFGGSSLWFGSLHRRSSRP